MSAIMDCHAGKSALARANPGSSGFPFTNVKVCGAKYQCPNCMVKNVGVQSPCEC